MGEDSGTCGADASSAAAAGVTVNIRCSNGSKLSVQTALDITVGEFKESLAGRCDVPAAQQRLIYKGRVLKDDHTLQTYGLESDDTIHLVRGMGSSTNSANISPSRGASTTPGSAYEVARGLGSTEGGELGATGLGGSLLQGLGSNGSSTGSPFSLFGSGLPEFDQMQRQLGQNPELVREIMNMPLFQSLLNNPDIMRNMITSNPQMRELMDRNPEIAHILNDPSMLRQTLEATRNPELMREVMRNTDRAMSNIESMPEGFNMLRRMYENVQEPFLNAATMAGNAGRDSGANPFAALLGNQGATQSGHAMQNQSTTNLDSAVASPAPNTNPLPNPWSNSAGGTQQAASRSAPASETRSTGNTGLGGVDFPNMESMAGGLQGASSFSQFMQNPVMQQTMQTILSDPQRMNQMLGLDPRMRSLLENPQVREMMQNPELLRLLTSPETIQQLLSFQQAFLPQFSRQHSNQGQNQAGEGAGTPGTAGLDALMNMFGGLAAGGLGSTNTSNVPPEELYATQLSQLQEMGFFDTQENIRALTATFGNVSAAVERLLGNLN